jgi:hypothetical protein
VPVLGAAQQVLAEVLEEQARFGEQGARRGVLAENPGAVEGRLGERDGSGA